MPQPAPNAALLASLSRLVRGLSALFWGLPVTLVVAVQTAKGEWLRPIGGIPVVLCTALLFYGVWLLGGFQRQERIWTTALERTRLVAIVNVFLSPFLFFWSKVSANIFFLVSVQLLAMTSLLFLYLLNLVLARLAAMLPDETLRSETKAFTRLNQTILAIIMCLLPVYLVLREIRRLPRLVVEMLLLVDGGGMFLQFALMLLFVLLPLAMTMALLWKTKEVILSSVFSNTDSAPNEMV